MRHANYKLSCSQDEILAKGFLNSTVGGQKESVSARLEAEWPMWPGRVRLKASQRVPVVSGSPQVWSISRTVKGKAPLRVS